MLRIRVPVSKEGFACIFVVCLSTVLTLQVDGVSSVVLQVSDGVWDQQRGSWNGELSVQTLQYVCTFLGLCRVVETFLPCQCVWFVSLFLYIYLMGV